MTDCLGLVELCRRNVVVIGGWTKNGGGTKNDERIGKRIRNCLARSSEWIGIAVR